MPLTQKSSDQSFLDATYDSAPNINISFLLNEEHSILKASFRGFALRASQSVKTADSVS